MQFWTSKMDIPISVCPRLLGRGMEPETVGLLHAARGGGGFAGRLGGELLAGGLRWKSDGKYS